VVVVVGVVVVVVVAVLPAATRLLIPHLERRRTRTRNRTRIRIRTLACPACPACPARCSRLLLCCRPHRLHGERLSGRAAALRGHLLNLAQPGPASAPVTAVPVGEVVAAVAPGQAMAAVSAASTSAVSAGMASSEFIAAVAAVSAACPGRPPPVAGRGRGRVPLLPLLPLLLPADLPLRLPPLQLALAHAIRSGAVCHFG
jgi:hypothetical protein